MTRIIFGADLANRVARLDWAKVAADRLRIKCQAHLAHGVVESLAEPPTGWAHRYICELCSSKYAWDLDSPHRHTCSSCGAVSEAPELHGMWKYYLNLNQISWARDALAIAEIDTDVAHADYARAVLEAYAASYGTMREHGVNAGTGRLQPQALCEAVWMLDAAALWRELQRAGYLQASQAASIAERLFAPAITLLKRQTSAVHNIHCWQAAAITALGHACGDAAAVAFGRRIIGMNLREGVRPAGLWYEVAPVYHHYTVEALAQYQLAEIESGAEGIAATDIATMLRATLDLVLPNGQLPVINDGWERAAIPVNLFEWACGLCDDFDKDLARVLDAEDRCGRMALRHGPDVVPEVQVQLPELAVVDGLCAMRRGGMMALVKASCDAGGHDHPERLSLNLYLADSELRMADPGNPGYGSPLHQGFFKRTVAHNTLLVDGDNQRLCDAYVQRSVVLPELCIVTTRCNGAYPDLQYARTVLLGDDWCVDWLRARSSDGERTFRALYHANGDLGDPEGQSEILVPNGYLKKQRTLARGDWSGVWRHPDGGELHASFQVEGGKERVGAAQGPFLPANTHRDAVICAAEGREFQVVASFGLKTLPVVCEQKTFDEMVFSIGGLRLRVGPSGDLTLLR
ncbi:MAG: heparinase II/III family protein [Planctomycetota bacterium]|jgi:hypothetical protein|nr:heparinase II/III family protein [Planctomycetota bacterium]